jgi:anthranilate synthase/aminodeoxychorismate synthase-like glutamine amidotransferase
VKVLVIDNYDSFTWNLVQYLQVLGAEVEVHRNDAISVTAIAEKNPDALLISPGPCDPSRAGISPDVVRHYAGKLPILGVCLGHQCIGEVFGGKVVPAQKLMHGKTSEIHHEGSGVFRGLPAPFVATRYHSLAVERDSLPAALQVTAWTDDGEIMGLRHREMPLEGVQFHPESILTESGMALLQNFLEMS